MHVERVFGDVRKVVLGSVIHSIESQFVVAGDGLEPAESVSGLPRAEDPSLSVT